ncbi:MAG: sigma-54 interaction domain-containing protein [Planctomycetota bacterium]
MLSETFGLTRPKKSPTASDRLARTRPAPRVVLTLGCEAAHAALREQGLAPRGAATLGEALAHVHDPNVRALALGPEDPTRASDAVAQARAEAPLTEVFLWAPGASPADLRRSLSEGAVVVVAAAPAALARAVANAIDRQTFLPRLQQFELARASSSRFEGLVSRSPAMWEVFETVVMTAPSGASVLILGETGVGKELLARAIHKRSGRRGRFVAVNCGSIPAGLVDSELFGHEEGTFTGATRSKPGLFRSADGGTLFLDEIGNLPLASQFSLLRALQEASVRPVGGDEEIPVDVRVVAATSAPLDEAVAQGTFREDLLFRLDVVRLVVPPLRARPEDVLHLFGYFRRKLTRHYDLEPPEPSDGFLEALLAHPWPGNARELENLVERLVLTHHGKRLTQRSFERLKQPYSAAARGSAPPSAEPRPAALRRAIAPAPAPEPGAAALLERTLDESLDALERRYLRAALAEARGRVDLTARIAGISPRTLLRKLRKHGLEKKEFKAPGQ